MGKKRKIFENPEEYAAWKQRSEERLRELEYWIERGKAELAAKGQKRSGAI